jgi:transcription elongation factor GreA
MSTSMTPGGRWVSSERALPLAFRAVSEHSEYLTSAQRAALEAELAELEGPKRAAAVQAIKTAREFGDLSENFEYHAAKNDQGFLEARIRKLRHRLQHAVTVEHDTDEHVGVGSLVELADEGGETMEVEISAVGGVSPDSPLGKALLGAGVGDVVDVEAPRGAWKARVLAIRRS